MTLYLEKNKQTCQALQEKAKEAGFNEGLSQFNKHLVWLEQKMKTIEHEMQKKNIKHSASGRKKSGL